MRWNGHAPRCRQWTKVRLVSEADYDFDTSVAHPARVYDYWLGGKELCL